MSSLLFAIFSLAVLRFTLATDYCPPLGPVHAVPHNLSTDESIRRAARNISATLAHLLDTGANDSTGFDANTTSFSVNLFSVHEPESIFQYHFTASTMNSSSTKKVDENSVYRIGSISKLVTTFGLLVQGNKVHFDDPITKYIPELDAIAMAHKSSANSEQDDVAMAQWSQITVGALAGHLAGIGRSFTTGDLAAFDLLVEQFGFPRLNQADVPTCGKDFTQAACSRQDFFKGFTARHPVYAPFTTPVYSNAGFQILGYVFENITGLPYEVALQNSIFKPLNLTRTSVKRPTKSSWGVIPVGDSEWDNDLGGQSSAGGIYTSTRDLSNLARAVLKSTLLQPAQTRKWLKPDTHTASLEFSVGAPWEIIRVNTLTQDRRVVDLYTKNGALGLYSSLLVLVPDYDIALVVLMAGPASPVHELAAMVLEAFLPIIEQVGKKQAATLYAGLYKCVSSHSVVNLTVDNGPGLSVKQWLNNGKDILQAYKSFRSDSQGDTDLRLYPTGLKNAQEVSFRAILQVLPPDDAAESHAGGPNFLSNPCTNWFGIDGLVYGSKAIDDFVFHLDSAGHVVSVEPRAVRQALQKQGSAFTYQE